jgi:hypothetical protein
MQQFHHGMTDWILLYKIPAKCVCGKRCSTLGSHLTLRHLDGLGNLLDRPNTYLTSQHFIQFMTNVIIETARILAETSHNV